MRRSPETRETGYTTTLKLMQIMADKGLVDSRRIVADACLHGQRVRRSTPSDSSLNDLVDRAFGGSAAALVLRALSTQSTSEKSCGRFAS